MPGGVLPTPPLEAGVERDLLVGVSMEGHEPATGPTLVGLLRERSSQIPAGQEVGCGLLSESVDGVMWDGPRELVESVHGPLEAVTPDVGVGDQERVGVSS